MFIPFAVQGAIAWFVRQRVLPLLNKSSLVNQMRLLQDGLALFQRQDFSSRRLQDLRAISFSPEGAVASLGSVHTQLMVVEQRSKEWFLIPSLVFCAGTHAAMSIAAWKRRNATAMKQWMSAWAEFEALNALATFAYEHPQYIYPEILAESTGIFEAAGLTHPLLQATAVANDITLNEQRRLYLISGSNMAGKSTLMRSIGMNVVLANAGAPIRATSARMSPLIVGASIALTDSLAEGRSKFLAEVERLQAILHIVRADHPQQRVLFLIDEIFSGTNSLDRKVAAEAVVRALVEHGAIGALSTHDLTLTEMADLPDLHAITVHMASPDANDPLAFDYLLKPGVNTTSNALAIVRMMGIAVP
jgi:DNA mismatch repair ATPase MutS